MNQRKSPYTGTRASVYGDFSVLCKKSVSLLPRGRSCFFWGHICILHFVCGLSSVRSHVGSGLVFRENNTSYSALATALAATIGTGNIIGISTAIAVGGAGAVFWCWITGVLGIATCYGECFLSMKYRKTEKDGKRIGGPMYVLERGMQQKGLAVLFSVFTILASLGIGSSVQAHSISAAITEQIPVSPHIIGMAAGVLAGKVIIGGSRQIGKVCTWLVPVMSAFYLGGCIFILMKNYTVIPEAVKMIVTSAFVPEAAAGGVVGTTVMAGLRTGISRGLFTNEAGLGSIPMAAATAQHASPRDQALVSMTGPFWDTVVMCAITGIASVSSMIAHPDNYVGCRGSGCVLPYSGNCRCGAMRCCRFHWSCLRLRRSSDGMSMASAPCGICLGKRVSAFTRSFI